jgi:hypothetical protein
VIALMVAYAIFLWTIPPARGLSIILSAHSEFLRYRVINPDFAVLRIAGMKALTAGDALTGCADAVITPGIGSQIEYRRRDNQYFRITVDPPSPGRLAFLLRAKDAEPRPFSQSVIFEASDTCPGMKPTQLPIWGPARFGDVLRPPNQEGRSVPAALISGKLSIYARAHDRLIGLSFPSSIYLVNSFELPSGSVLSAPGNDASSAWIGIADVENGKPGFTIQAESTARTITLRGAGTIIGPRQTDERIELGSYAQFLTDPNIIKIQSLLGAFLLLFQTGWRIIAFINTYILGAARDQNLE